MKILQISPQISYPFDSGGRLSIYGITKSLSERGHKIIFVTYVKEYPKQEHIIELKKICEPVFIKWNTNNSLWGIFLNIFSSVPYNISKYYSKKLEYFLKDFLTKDKIDLVHIDHLHMSWTVDIIKKLTKIPVVLREHNLEMKIMKRFGEVESNFILKFYSKIQFKRFLKYEPAQCRKFDRCIMITKEDETELLELSPEIKTKVIPAGVDNKLFTLGYLNTIPFSIYHIGSLNWEPNYDGLLWFLSEVFPKVISKFPETKLYIYSKGIERLVLNDSINKNIILCGYVKDIWQEILDKQMMVVPLKVGSGMRIKIIEMLAAGKIVVSTSVGKEGIEVENGQQILIADDSNSFIKTISDIFSNKLDLNKITLSAKEIIKEKYSWESVSIQFESEYLYLIKSSSNGTKKL
ncbi:MAG: glycosyltransferase family 4 protein [Ignavibacterium sp.]|jgi:glycosyltransferase involved in cell wall biosynthesis|nr:glycosyltransferase family 4 protein [Ignavibacterium sp.]MDX9711024.1 glycosyltransferase family 4 protein [Ignavibacteriaceae bacterium]